MLGIGKSILYCSILFCVLCNERLSSLYCISNFNIIFYILFTQFYFL